jgi:MFS transporter, ACS family, D-galactonate transporter
MLALVLIATIINYVARVNISVAAPFMSKDLGIDKVQLGFIFSAFSWTYAFALLPGGYFVDRLGSRLMYGISLIFWSLATALQGVASGFTSLFAFRLGVGLMEGPAFPANTRAVTMWFPQQERSLATSIFLIGQYVSTAMFAAPLLWLTVTSGWRPMFYLTGGLGIAFGFVWLWLYRDPMQSRRANEAELRYIEEGGGLARNAVKSSATMAQVLQLFRYRQVWAVCLGKFCSNTVLTFFLTWFPTYLLEERKITILKTGFFTVMPYLGATAGILLAGAFSDWMIRRGWSMSFSRKLPLVVGSALGMSIILCNLTDSNELCIAILTLTFFAQGVSSTSWAAVAEIAPKELIAMTGGVTSFAANLTGIVSPVVIGMIVQGTGSFVWAINLMAALSLCGTLSYWLWLGRIHRITLAPAGQ